MRPSRFLALILTAAGLSAQPSERPRVFAIRDARIVPVSGPEIAQGVVVLRDGLIASVGAASEIPADAWIIEGEGLSVYPGFIDSLSTLGMPDEKKFPPVYGKRPASGPDDRPATSTWALGVDHFAAENEAVETWRNGGFTSVAVAPRQGILPGQVSLLNLDQRPVAGAVQAKAGLLIQLNAERSRETGFPSSLFGAMSYVDQIFLDARQAQQAKAIYEESPAGLERPEYDRTLTPIVEVLANNSPVLYPGNTEIELRRALDRTAALSKRPVVYGAQQAYRDGVAKDLAEGAMQALVNLSWPEAPKDADPDAQVSARVLRFRSRAPTSPKALSEASVTFGVYGSDAKSPKDLMDGLRKAIEAGLSAEAAVEALTLGPARIYGVADRLGSLEAGKIANLVVYRDDPFAEKSRPVMVFVDGQKFDMPAESEAKEKEDDAE